jgi:hypothetical protein
MSNEPRQPEHGSTPGAEAGGQRTGHAIDSPAAQPDAPYEPKRCVHCGYTLDYIPDARCPECGNTYNLYNLGTYDGGPFPRERRFPRTTWGALLLTTLMLLLLAGVCWLFICMMQYAFKMVGVIIEAG